MVPAFLCLLAALLPGRPAGDPAGPRLSVEVGRAQVWSAEGVLTRTPADGPLLLGFDGRVDLGARTRAEWALPGVGAVRLEGPGGFEWETGGSRPLFGLDELGAADVEVRRGPIDLVPAAGWRLELARGVYRVERESDGAVRVRACLGGPARALWRGERARVLPPIPLPRGEALRLDGPPPVPDRVVGPTGRPWPFVRWPFGRPSPRTLALFERAARPPWPRPEWPFAPPVETAPPWPEASWPFGGSGGEAHSSSSPPSSAPSSKGASTPPWM